MHAALKWRCVVTINTVLYNVNVCQGDRLRQLPSNAGDNSEIMRMLSGVEEGPEQLMNVEDYLNPNRLAFSTDVSYPVLSVSRVSRIYCCHKHHNYMFYWN